MLVKSLGPVPASDQVLFLCGQKAQLLQGELCTGVLPSAFKMSEDGISVSWVEYFLAPPPPLEQAAAAIKRELTPRKSGVLACAAVIRISEIAAKLGLNATVTHDPQAANHGHALITGWPDNLGSRVALARAFLTIIPNTDVPGFL